MKRSRVERLWCVLLLVLSALVPGCAPNESPSSGEPRVEPVGSLASAVFIPSPPCGNLWNATAEALIGEALSTSNPNGIGIFYPGTKTARVKVLDALGPVQNAWVNIYGEITITIQNGLGTGCPESPDGLCYSAPYTQTLFANGLMEAYTDVNGEAEISTDGFCYNLAFLDGIQDYIGNGLGYFKIVNVERHPWVVKAARTVGDVKPTLPKEGGKALVTTQTLGPGWEGDGRAVITESTSGCLPKDAQSVPGVCRAAESTPTVNMDLVVTPHRAMRLNIPGCGTDSAQPGLALRWGPSSPTSALIFFEGLDGNNEVYPQHAYALLSSAFALAGKNVHTADGGADQAKRSVWMYSFSNSTASGRNCLVAEAKKAIEGIKNLETTGIGNQISVAAFSMGGVLARAALAQLDAENKIKPFRINSFISLDSPHQGAEVHPRISQMVRQLGNDTSLLDPSFADQIRIALAKVDSAAARELLISRCTDTIRPLSDGMAYIDSLGTCADEDWATSHGFRDWLKTLNPAKDPLRGYPTRVKKFAMTFAVPTFGLPALGALFHGDVGGNLDVPVMYLDKYGFAPGVGVYPWSGRHDFHTQLYSLHGRLHHMPGSRLDHISAFDANGAAASMPWYAMPLEWWQRLAFTGWQFVGAIPDASVDVSTGVNYNPTFITANSATDSNQACEDNWADSCIGSVGNFLDSPFDSVFQPLVGVPPGAANCIYKAGGVCVRDSAGVAQSDGGHWFHNEESIVMLAAPGVTGRDSAPSYGTTSTSGFVPWMTRALMAIPYPEVAEGRPVTASSTAGGLLASSANDDDITTDWATATGATPGTLVIDLQDPHEIYAAQLWNRSDGSNPNYLKDFVIEVSIDGSTYVQIQAPIVIAPSNLYPMTVYFDSTLFMPQVRYVRLRKLTSDHLHLSEVKIYGLNLAPVLEIAQGKTADASSAAFEPRFANDGLAGAGSTSWSSNAEAGAWFQVDFAARYRVGKVELWNRGDGCCASRLKNYRIQISEDGMSWVDSGHGVIATVPSHLTPATFSIPNISGRYVRVSFTTTDYHHIGEIKVYGTALPSSPPVETAPEVANPAALAANGGSLSVSSTLGGSSSSFANDGDPSSIWTSYDSGYGWLKLDLGKLFDVSTLRLRNRGDRCCADRLRDFVIETSVDGVLWAPTAPGTISVAPSHQVFSIYTLQQRARFVRVRSLKYHTYFHVAEIQVFAWPVTGGSPQSAAPFAGAAPPVLEVAQGKASLASSNAGGMDSVYALDGLSGPGTPSWSSISEAAAWFQVDLGAFYDVSSVSLWNRGDGCCGDRLRNFFIQFSTNGLTWTDSGLGLIPTQPSHLTPSSFAVGNQVARYVRIAFSSAGYHHIGELKVFAAAIGVPAGVEGAGELANQATLTTNGGSISVSSSESTFVAARANDGILTNFWSSAPSGQAFFKVDLGASFDVANVRLLNRGDGCCGERLRDFVIETSSDNVSWLPIDAGTIQLPPSHLVFTPYRVERRARYVRVRHNPLNQRLHLGEIKIYGWPVTGGTPASGAPWL